MAFSDIYRKQVSLLVRTLPHVAEEPCFAGMTDEPVSPDELSAAREALIAFPARRKSLLSKLQITSFASAITLTFLPASG